MYLFYLKENWQGIWYCLLCTDLKMLRFSIFPFCPYSMSILYAVTSVKLPFDFSVVWRSIIQTSNKYVKSDCPPDVVGMIFFLYEQLWSGKWWLLLRLMVKDWAMSDVLFSTYSIRQEYVRMCFTSVETLKDHSYIFTWRLIDQQCSLLLQKSC